MVVDTTWELRQIVEADHFVPLGLMRTLTLKCCVVLSRHGIASSLVFLCCKYRIIFKVLLITFKAIHGLAPVYISELISIRDVSLSRYCLCLTNSLTLNFPALKSRKTLGNRSFFVAAPKLWNELPSDIRDLNSINSFKTAIKTYLFRQAFL